MQTRNHSATADAPSIDTVFRLLRDPRRRYVAALLSERDGPVALTDLAEAVADWETDSDESSPRTDAVALDLHHRHLPALADAGVVAYDVEAETAAPDRTEPVAPFLPASECPP